MSLTRKQYQMILSMISGLRIENTDEEGNIHIRHQYYSAKEIEELIENLETETT